MLTQADDAGGDLRAKVTKLWTDRCGAYEEALVATGSQVTQGTYTIPCDILAPQPRPTVALNVYSDQAGTVQATEVVQAVYRDSGTLQQDPATGDWYSEFRFFVLVALEIPNAAGRAVNCFTWAVDPEKADGAVPIDAAAGVEGFDFNDAWTPAGP